MSVIMKEDFLMVLILLILFNVLLDEGERNEVGGVCDGGDKLF